MWYDRINIGQRLANNLHDMKITSFDWEEVRQGGKEGETRDVGIWTSLESEHDKARGDNTI